MDRFEQTRLWQSTLATQLGPDPEAALRRKLRVALESFRERAKALAAEIARDLPEFTVHDISHIDALWEMAQLVAGEDLQLTPAEAFVLGGAFLVHDLGMSLAAYPHGVSEIRNTSLWKDTVAAELKQRLGRTPTADEIASPDYDLDRYANSVVLREFHAQKAESLALTSWTDNQGNQFHLIEDPELRLTYGRIIGLIAHSHWWPVNALESKFPKELGAPGGFSNTWTVDPLKLACILRCADIAHLDDRRAPAFLRSIRAPSGPSSDHWDFQGKLYQPRLEADRLVFSAKSSFSVEEATSWWLCYDTLKDVDRELELVDSLLADTSKARLAARGVAYINEPFRLARLIPTDGWYPVDARVKVGAVASLVRKLGGSELYGNNLAVPLRELIQNAADAVRARRVIEGLPEDWGIIKVAVTHDDEGGMWIEVSDSGVGMSEGVIVGPFLDFGTSFWGSDLMHREFPGLETTGFTSTGKYGIGFFSVFMWGDRVQVFSRRFEKGREATIALEFEAGLGSRPILRPAKPKEYLRDGGTTIRVLLKQGDMLDKMLEPSEWRESHTLQELCARLCATLDVTVEVSEWGKKSQIAVNANDWLSIDGEALLLRINRPLGSKLSKEIKVACKRLGPLLTLVEGTDGRIVGRACPTVGPWEMGHVTPYGLVTVGGFEACELTGIVGVLLGESQGAARNRARPFLDGAALAAFATRHAPLLSKLYAAPEAQSSAAKILCVLGGEPRGLVISRSSSGWLTIEQIEAWARTHSEILLVEEYAVDIENKLGAQLILNNNVLTVESGHPVILQGYLSSDWPQGRGSMESSSIYTIVSAIARAWNLRAQDLWNEGRLRETQREIGTIAGRLVRESVSVLTTKQSHKKRKT